MSPNRLISFEVSSYFHCISSSALVEQEYYLLPSDRIFSGGRVPIYEENEGLVGC
jgi:hypothetical protein